MWYFFIFSAKTPRKNDKNTPQLTKYFLALPIWWYKSGETAKKYCFMLFFLASSAIFFSPYPLAHFMHIRVICVYIHIRIDDVEAREKSEREWVRDTQKNLTLSFSNSGENSRIFFIILFFRHSLLLPLFYVCACNGLWVREKKWNAKLMEWNAKGDDDDFFWVIFHSVQYSSCVLSIYIYFIPSTKRVHNVSSDSRCVSWLTAWESSQTLPFF